VIVRYANAANALEDASIGPIYVPGPAKLTITPISGETVYFSHKIQAN
jgi:hypothetical protein